MAATPNRTVTELIHHHFSLKSKNSNDKVGKSHSKQKGQKLGKSEAGDRMTHPGATVGLIEKAQERKAGDVTEQICSRQMTNASDGMLRT